jgi:hypothetical protein
MGVPLRRDAPILRLLPAEVLVPAPMRYSAPNGIQSLEFRGCGLMLRATFGFKEWGCRVRAWGSGFGV